ncbi:MAG: GNAT family N-acetyltransferase, partial [Cytophagales bacterium]|nr:GNAT family N-acetyltransferase [Cytophagales bacterium]
MGFLLHEWISRPHVARWWGSPAAEADLHREYLPVISGAVPSRCYVALLREEPIGFSQWYIAAAFHDEG